MAFDLTVDSLLQFCRKAEQKTGCWFTFDDVASVSDGLVQDHHFPAAFDDSVKLGLLVRGTSDDQRRESTSAYIWRLSPRDGL